MVADERMLFGIGIGIGIGIEIEIEIEIVSPLWPPGQILMAYVISFTSRVRFLFPVDTDPDSDPDPEGCCHG
jgi:hypothetical protein